jgi:hypothetical protein
MGSATTKEVRDYLVHVYFEEKFAFRKRMAAKAEKRPGPGDVEKNEAYALSLHRVAGYVANLPDDDPRLRALAECPAFYNEDAGLFEIPSDLDGLGSLSDQAAVHCGPRGKAMEPDKIGTWFSGWVDDLIEEAPKLRANRERELKKLCGLGEPEEAE